MATKRNNRNKRSQPELRYKNHPRAISLTIYDFQGDPISRELADLIEDYARRVIKAANIRSLAIDVTRE